MNQTVILTTTGTASLIFKRVKKYRWVIILGAAVLGLLLAIYAKNSPVTYTSKAILFSLTSSNDNATASSALSLLLGSESGKTFNDETSINIIELAQSRTTREAVAATRVPAMGNRMIAALLADDINDHRGLFQHTVKPPKDSLDLVTWGGEILKPAIVASINKNNSFVLNFTGRSEELVKIISYEFIDKISQFYIDLKREKAKRDYEFATGKVDSLRRVMNAKDNVLIATDNRTLFTNTERLQYRVPNENLLADKQMIRNQYAQAVANQQSAAYKLQKDTPLVRVLDKPEPPFDKDSKSVILYGLIGLVAGAALTAGLLVSRLVLLYTKQELSKAIFGIPATTSTTASVL